MRAVLVHLEAYEDIVCFETKRIGHVPGYDLADLKQEARFVVARALPRINRRKSTGRTYVQKAVQNKLRNLKRAALTSGRVPKDRWGRTQHVTSCDAPLTSGEARTLLDVSAAPVRAADEQAAARELVTALYKSLSKREMKLLTEVFVHGAKINRDRARGLVVSGSEIDRVRSKARDSLTRLLETRRPRDVLRVPEYRSMLRLSAHRVDRDLEDANMTPTKKNLKLPVVDLKVVNSCHALQPVTSEGGGEGYDPDPKFGCAECPDKTTCISHLIDNPSKNKARPSGPLSINDGDNEMKAVFAGVITNDDMLARLKKRTKLKESGGTIPEDLLPTFDLIAAAKAKKPEPEQAAEPEVAEEAAAEETSTETSSESAASDDEKKSDDAAATDADDDKSDDDKSGESTEDTTMGTTKKSKKSSKAKAAPKAKAAKAAAKPKVARPRLPKKDRTRIYTKSDGPERFLPQPRENNEEQQKAALGRIALGQDFEIAEGMEIVRKKRDGSEIVVKVVKNGFKMDGVIYSSLSAAGQWASKRAVSGNDFFNIENYSCTEIRGSGVPGAVISKQGKGKSALVGAHGPGKVASPKKGAAKKAAKKSAPPPPPKKAAAKKKAAKK